jgi:type II secretory pathway component GspD/PulD (secretin)
MTSWIGLDEKKASRSQSSRWVGGGVLLLAAVWLGGGCTRKQPPAPQEPPRVWMDGGRPIEELTAATTRPAPLPEPLIIEDEVVTGPGATTQPATQPTVDVPRKGTLIYVCRHARSETLKEAVEGLISPEGSIQASSTLNTLIISDNIADVRMVLKALQAIDRSVPQLLVEARVVEVTLDSDLEYEIEHLLNINAPNAFFQGSKERPSKIDLNTPGPTPTENQGGLLTIRPWYSNGDYLQEFVRLLMTRGKGRILSSPNLLVAPGTEASIITGEEVPIQSSQVVSGSLSTSTQFKRVGIKLRVQLLQLTGDTARLEIQPEVSTVTRFTETAPGVSNPIIAIRNVSSTLSMKDGEVLTVGGLLRDEDREVIRGVPGLMDVPVVGLLFQSRRHQKVKTQLIFFLRIHILADGAAGSIRVHKPGSAMDLLEEKAGIVEPEAKKTSKPAGEDRK